MSYPREMPFDSLENAQQYIRILSEVVAEATKDIDNEITIATGQMSYRRLQALRIVEYKLEKLQRYLSVTGRTLNDLRTLRRMIFEERSATNHIKPRQITGTPPLTGTAIVPAPGATD